MIFIHELIYGVIEPRHGNAVKGRLPGALALAASSLEVRRWLRDRPHPEG